MDKKDSIAFLKECIANLERVTQQDIQFYKKVYEDTCTMAVENSNFEFIIPTKDTQYIDRKGIVRVEENE